MTRIIPLLLGSLLLAAAAPRTPPWMPLPLPPPLPLDPPSDQAAPVPAGNLAAVAQAGRSQTEFALRFYQMQEYGTGDGYIPGSAYESPEERKPMQTPGFLVTIPLR